MQVSYVTKSGTNQFHGNAEYWWTGRAMDANDYFNNLNGTPRPFANNNEWADSFGGPIKKDKLFFFADNEGIRYIVPSSTTVFSPTAGICQCRPWLTWRLTDPAEFRSIRRCSTSTQTRSGVQPGQSPVRRQQRLSETSTTFRRQLLPAVWSYACSAGHGIHHQRTC